MLKFQWNQTKPELIRILFVTWLDLVDSTKEAMVAYNNRKTGTYKRKPMFGSKKSRITTRDLKIEWEHLFQTLLRRFRWKKTLTGYKRTKRERNKKESETVWRAAKLFNLGLRDIKFKKAYFRIILVLEASNCSQITFLYPSSVLNSISERSGPIFEQINISLTATAIMVAHIQIYYINKTGL